MMTHLTKVLVTYHEQRTINLKNLCQVIYRKLSQLMVNDFPKKMNFLKLCPFCYSTIFKMVAKMENLNFLANTTNNGVKSKNETKNGM